MSPAIDVSKISNSTRRATIVKVNDSFIVWHCNLYWGAHWFCLSTSGFKNVSPAPQFGVGVDGASVAVTAMHFCNCHCVWEFNLHGGARSRCPVVAGVVVSPAVNLSGNSKTTPCAVCSAIKSDEAIIVWQRHLCGGCYVEFSR